MAKTKETHDYEAIGRAVVLIASLFGSTAVAASPPAQATTSTPASQPDAPSEPAATTSTQTEADTSFDIDGLLAANAADLSSDDLRAAAEATLTVEQFGKLGMKFAKRLNDNGAKAKEIWKGYKTADGGAVSRFGETKPDEYAKMLGEMAEALAEAELA